MSFTDSSLFAWLILPILIFCARVIDVSIGTLRIVYIARGQKLLVPLLGFFEVMIWLFAMTQIFKHLNNFACYIGWAGGFAMGNYVGMYIENRLAIGLLVLRIITRSEPYNLVTHLRDTGYGVTLIDGEGMNGPVKILFVLIKRKDLSEVIAMIKQHAPKAFYTVEDVQAAQEAMLPVAPPHQRNLYWRLFKMDRKRK